MKLGEFIKYYRLSQKLSLRDFAKLCGTSHGYISMLEEGKNSKTGEPITPKIQTLKKIADAMNMSLNDLFLKVDDMPIELSNDFFSPLRPIKKTRFPMLGEIACGQPIFANQDFESFVDAAEDIDANFCLTARGDSMIDVGIKNGDVVFIREQPIVNNGEIAAVIIDDEATLKIWHYYPDENKLLLLPANRAYAPLIYTGEQLNSIHCLGKAVCYISNL